MAPVQAILELQIATKPQRLSQILASLHYLLTFNTEAQDYHFIVDPIDREILTGRRIAQIQRLINRITNGAVIVVGAVLTCFALLFALCSALSALLYSFRSKSQQNG